jgi:hypothetical protein
MLDDEAGLVELSGQETHVEPFRYVPASQIGTHVPDEFFSNPSLHTHSPPEECILAGHVHDSEAGTAGTWVYVTLQEYGSAHSPDSSS